MTVVTEQSIPVDPARAERRAQLFTRINKMDTYFQVIQLMPITWK